MRYIISESRLNNFIFQYLDNWEETKVSYRNYPWIIIEEPDEDDAEQYMELDRTDGRLWIHKLIRKDLMNLFNKSEEEINAIVGKWFSDRFEEEVKFVE